MGFRVWCGSSRVTPDGLHVFVVSAHICSGDVLEGGARSSRGVTCDGAFYAFYSGFEHFLKQAFKANCTWTTMSHLFAWTGSGVLRKAMKVKMFGFGITQGGPVPEDILVWYVFAKILTPMDSPKASHCSSSMRRVEVTVFICRGFWFKVHKRSLEALDMRSKKRIKFFVHDTNNALSALESPTPRLVWLQQSLLGGSCGLGFRAWGLRTGSCKVHRGQGHQGIPQDNDERRRRTRRRASHEPDESRNANARKARGSG